MMDTGQLNRLKALTKHPMDYKALLKKYMGLVVECESFSFLPHINSFGSEYQFSEKEEKELRAIEKELADE